ADAGPDSVDGVASLEQPNMAALTSTETSAATARRARRFIVVVSPWLGPPDVRQPSATSGRIDRSVHGAHRDPLAVDDVAHVEHHEPMTLPLERVVDPRTNRQAVAVVDQTVELHRARHVDPRAEAHVVGKRVVRIAEQPTGMSDSFVQVDRQGLTNVGEVTQRAFAMEADLDRAEHRVD